MAKYKDELLDHEYDGIQELDNDMPPWWLYLFYFTIVWAVVYFVYYHVTGTGYLSGEEYAQEMDPNWSRASVAGDEESSFFPAYHSPYYDSKDMTPRKKLMDLGGGEKDKSTTVAVAEPVNYEVLTDEVSLASGKVIFLEKCASCHGNLGEGGIGPNMTDKYWLHGGQFNDIVNTIIIGVPAKGMISWRGFLKPDKIVEVSSYITTLQGTNPPKAKAPQGEELVEE